MSETAREAKSGKTKFLLSCMRGAEVSVCTLPLGQANKCVRGGGGGGRCGGTLYGRIFWPNFLALL